MKRGITDESLKMVYSDLEALSKKPKITPVKDAIKFWEVVIRKSLEQGYTYADICKVFSNRDIKIAPATLRQYLADLDAEREEQTHIKGALEQDPPAGDQANDASVVPQQQPSTPGVVVAEKPAEIPAKKPVVEAQEPAAKPVPDKVAATSQSSTPLQQQKLSPTGGTTTTRTTRISAANAAANTAANAEVNSQKNVVAISAKGRREIPVPPSQTRDSPANSGSGSPPPNAAIS